MANPVTVKIEGLKELQAKLEALGPKIGKKVEQGALLEGGELMRNAFAENAPKDTGLLAGHFIAKVTRKIRGTSRNDLVARVIVGGESAIYYPGRKNEDISNFIKRLGKSLGKTGQVLRGITINNVLRFLEFGTTKEKKRPFMSQAFESKKQQVLDKIIDGIREGIDEASR